MNLNRLWTLGSVIVIIALLVGTWFVGVSPRLDEASTANADRELVEGQNVVHNATLVALRAQFEGLGELKSDLEELRASVPEDDATSTLIRQFHSTAASAGVRITELTLDAPERYAIPAEPSADAELASAASSVTPDNFVTIPVKVSLAGQYGRIMNFLAATQTGDRLLLVHDFDLPDGIPASDTATEATFTGQIFVLLENVAPVAPEVPAAAPVGEAATEEVQ